MTRQQLLDLYFMDARSKLIDLAAFLDRVDRGGRRAPISGSRRFAQALAELERGEPDRAREACCFR